MRSWPIKNTLGAEKSLIRASCVASATPKCFFGDFVRSGTSLRVYLAENILRNAETNEEGNALQLRPTPSLFCWTGRTEEALCSLCWALSFSRSKTVYSPAFRLCGTECIDALIAGETTPIFLGGKLERLFRVDRPRWSTAC